MFANFGLADDIGTHTVVMPRLLAHEFVHLLGSDHDGEKVGQASSPMPLLLDDASMIPCLSGTRSTASTRTCHTSPVLGGSFSCLRLLVRFALFYLLAKNYDSLNKHFEIFTHCTTLIDAIAFLYLKLSVS